MEEKRVRRPNQAAGGPPLLGQQVSPHAQTWAQRPLVVGAENSTFPGSHVEFSHHVIEPWLNLN